MGAIDCHGLGRTGKPANRLESFGGARAGPISRAALLAGASLVALAALDAPGVARACSGAPQTISNVVSGPILSTNGAIAVTSNGGGHRQPGWR